MKQHYQITFYLKKKQTFSVKIEENMFHFIMWTVHSIICW